MALPRVKCNRWKSGICLELAVPQAPVTYCPRARAENCGPGECCHHSLFQVRDQLEEMKRAGVKLKRYGRNLRDPEFVGSLHAAFLKARSRQK